MKTIKTSREASVEIFETDALHSFYDFNSGEKGDILLDRDLIRELKQYSITNLEKLPKAWALLNFLKDVDVKVEPESVWNFKITVKRGKINITVGNQCAKILEDSCYYRDYLKQLESNGIETYIEFQI